METLIYDILIIMIILLTFKNKIILYKTSKNMDLCYLILISYLINLYNMVHDLIKNTKKN